MAPIVRPGAWRSATSGSARLGFTVFGREPRARKVGDEYVDEDQMILMLR